MYLSLQELKKYGIPATPSLRRAINERAVVAEQKILCHVRALFDYHPYDDQLMPCPEAGLGFQFGDVLAILNQASKRTGRAWVAIQMTSHHQVKSVYFATRCGLYVLTECE